jgi:competence protein ComEA
MKLLKVLFVSLFLAFASASLHAAPVDINSADAKTIAKVMNGVGIKKAEAIVAYRNKHGKFKSVDDLAKVKGIGKKTVAKNRKNLTLSNSK